jgi:eukaryotic-like serine/threonine-protein kinase
MVWAVGRSLKGGQYVVDKVLHQGHLSVSYRALSSQGHKVVIKTPSDTAISQVDFNKLQERFVGEAFKLKSCQKSPYIVQVEDPFQEDGRWCIPMEYIAGTNLDDRGEPRRLPEAEAIGYVGQVGQALVVLHAQGLIHRDVAPNNIMLRSRNGINEAVLIDFGLVRDFTLSTSVTSTQKKTPYTARELCLPKQDRGYFTDLYGLGAVLYNLVTGWEPPMALDREPNDSLKFPAGVSSGVERVIESAMARKGSDRPASVTAWLEQLNQLSAEKLKSSEPKSIEDPEKTHKRRIETWQVVAVIIAAVGSLMAGIGAIMSANKSDPPKPTPSVSQVATPTGGPSPVASPRRSP